MAIRDQQTMMNVRKVYLKDWSAPGSIIKLGIFLPVPDKSIGERLLQATGQGSCGCVASLVDGDSSVYPLVYGNPNERLPQELE